MRDDLGGGEVGGVNVEIATHDLQVGGYGAEEVVCGGIGEVAEAEDLADFAGGEEFFELWGEGEVNSWRLKRGREGRTLLGMSCKRDC